MEVIKKLMQIATKVDDKISRGQRKVDDKKLTRDNEEEKTRERREDHSYTRVSLPSRSARGERSLVLVLST